MVGVRTENQFGQGIVDFCICRVETVAAKTIAVTSPLSSVGTCISQPGFVIGTVRVAEHDLGCRVDLGGDHGILAVGIIAAIESVAGRSAYLIAFQKIVRIKCPVRYHAAQRIGAPQNRCRPTLDFDGFQGRHIDEVAVAGIVGFDHACTVNHDLDPVSTHTADRKSTEAAKRCGSGCLAIDGNTGLVTDQFLNVVDIVIFDFFTGDDTDHSRCIQHFFFLSCRGYRDGTHFMGRFFMGFPV